MFELFSMEGQNMAYNEDEYSENYQLQDQSQYDAGDGGGGGYAPAGQNPIAQGSSSAGSLFRSEEMALCQLFLQVCSLKSN